jgi:hypothetical protein
VWELLDHWKPVCGTWQRDMVVGEPEVGARCGQGWREQAGPGVLARPACVCWCTSQLFQPTITQPPIILLTILKQSSWAPSLSSTFSKSLSVKSQIRLRSRMKRPHRPLSGRMQGIRRRSGARFPYVRKCLSTFVGK